MEDTRHNINHLTPGMQLCGGKYVIENKIGEGGFGITYRAVQKGLNRAVCIKEFFPAGRCMRDPSSQFVYAQGVDEDLFNKYRQAFRREAETLAKLQHPGIVEVIEIFDENNTTYMVMPFVEGRTLQQMVEQQGPLPYPEAVNYIAQIAEAVAYLHKNHILHRDIKPSNIIVTAEYRTVLIDFGSAREFINDKTQAHTSILTHGYAPTEQYSTTSRKGSYTDIYAIGATLYFVLTGQVPMDAATRMNEEMPEPRSINSSIPHEANRTILKAMQMKAADRYQNVQEFMDDLCNVHSWRGTAPVPSSPTVSQPSEKKRSSTALFIILGILGLAITVVIASLILSHGASDRHDDDDSVAVVKAPEMPNNINEETPIESKEEELARYQQIYADYIRTNCSNENYEGWDFIYVDEDNVPEMFLPTGYKAGGCLLLSYHNGRVQESVLQLSFEYIPYKNRIRDSNFGAGGNSGRIAELREGTLHCLGEYENMESWTEESDEYIVEYISNFYIYIDDSRVEVSESEYDDFVQRKFSNLGRAVDARDGSSLRPMSELWSNSSSGLSTIKL